MSNNTETPETPAEAGEQLKQTGDTDLPDDPVVVQLKRLNGNVAALNDNVRTTGKLIAEMNASTKPSTDAVNDSGASDDEETDTTVTIEHEYDTDELEESGYDWIQRAADFNNDLIAEAVEVEFGQVDGDVGLIITRGKPWNSDCYEGDEWTDKDRWDAHGEAFKSVMQSKDDHIVYHGEPDYFNFLPASECSEVF